ncbi:MAG TPA: DUF1207 domain-containing protein [Nitrospirota bacterium]|nr:DUF1207 domain-containing protein [Nitrospirota bacterium]
MPLGSSPESNQDKDGESKKEGKNIFLPRGNLFQPLLADPKELRFYLGYRPYQKANHYLSRQTEMFTGGLGDMFGLFRHTDNGRGYALQANISGGIYAEFDLKTSSYFLVDNDYYFGLPFTLRSGPYSYRLNLYHQSSHVGDEYLQHSTIQRVEFSYEALNIIASYDIKKWRVYYGGEVIVHKSPSTYKPVTVQGGIEYYDTQQTLLGGRIVGGVDLKCTEENNWPLNLSAKAGLQFDEEIMRGRAIRFLLEGYEGYSPQGQFFNNRMTYIGLGITFEFQ